MVNGNTDTIQQSNAQELNGNRLVIGGNRGIGLALVKAQLDNAQVRQVIATHRPQHCSESLATLARAHTGRLLTLPLDVTDPHSLQAFGETLKGFEGGVDLTIHAAGLLHDDHTQPEKSLQQCDAPSLLRLFQINSIGPLMVARALLPLQSRRRHFTFAALSAMVGSIGDNRRGGWYGYRASKAALNQLMRTLAMESKVRHPNAAIVSIHPGTTDTALSRPFQGNVEPGKLYSPQLTATRLLSVLQGINHRHSGQFFNWDGKQIPW